MFFGWIINKRSNIAIFYWYDDKFASVNQMWILKNSKDLLEYIQSKSLSSCNSIKTFYFSTLYTTIPHSKLKDKLRELVQLCFIKKNDQRFRLTTYLLSLVDVFFNRQSAYQWAQTVLLFSPTCSFIRMRQNSYRGFSRKTKRN